MLPFNPTSYRHSGDAAKLLDARFLSLPEGITGKTYTIRQPSPSISDRVCIGSSPDGWLITADASSELHLLNPLTGVQLSLPPAATLPLINAIHDAAGRVVSYTCYNSLDCCCSCFGDDDGDGEAPVVTPDMTISPDLLRYGVYEKAILVSPPRRMAPSGEWGGYAVVLICNPLSRDGVHDGHGGARRRMGRGDDLAADEHDVEGDRAAVPVLVSAVRSHVGGVPQVEDDGGGWPELRGNCVYFTDDGPWSDERCHEVAPDVGVLDLADGSYRPPRGAAREMVWKWPPPVWVFPSLATN
ncbi:hypothetical protein HU200_006119 [Digitaria exilis]|uniref:KIB1-4 beta-propeller domain-containing protein n=1 Tax=Digitaria exilis TaxID=1010633 RepID=A0A835FPL2_9POAL|nr:hypothetical protein HU200_006119 [Digitaria exilis]